MYRVRLDKHRHKKRDNSKEAQQILLLCKQKIDQETLHIKKKGNVLFKVLPLHDVLWDIFHGVLQEKPVLMSEQRAFMVFKGNLVYRIAEGEFFGVRGDAI